MRATNLSLLVMLAGLLILPITLVEYQSTNPVQIKIQETSQALDSSPPQVGFHSPKDGETLPLGIIEIDYYVHDESDILTTYLVINDRLVDLTHQDTPYLWDPINEGRVSLQLLATDIVGNSAFMSINVFISVSSSTIATPFIFVIIGFLGLLSFGYVFQLKKQSRWSIGYIEDEENLYVPLHYIVLSKIRQIMKR